MKKRNSIFAILLAIMMVFTYIPGLTYAAAGDEPESGMLSAAGSSLVVPDAETAGNDELLEQYFNSEVDKALGKSVQQRSLKSLKSPRRERLSITEKYIYDQILAKMQAVASGDDSRAVLKINLRDQFDEYLVDSGYTNYPLAITSESLGLQTDAGVYVRDGEAWALSEEAKKKLYDIGKVVDAFLLDQPYCAYWFDKSTGYLPDLNAHLDTSGTSSDAFFPEDPGYPVLTISFAVAEDYRADGGDLFEFNTEKARSAAAAVEHVDQFIKDNREKNDVEKLFAYKNAICDLTSYNHNAAYDPYTPYGDPWQLIYVFDGDVKTTVVCEGYAKAFQLLCDESTFSSGEIDCSIVTGNMDEEGHMWNILHMDDGKNYLADITNCDPDNPKIGYRDDLFLKGYTSGSIEDGYIYTDKYIGRIHYLYDAEAFVQYDHKELEMSDSEYCIGGDPVRENVVEFCTEEGSYDEVVYCRRCGKELSRTHKELPAAGHRWARETYAWNKDYTEVTGTRKCTGCSESVVAVAKRAGSEVTKAPTALGKGEIVYTSEEFTEEGFEAQIIRVAIPALVDTDPVLRTFTGIPDSKIKKVKGLKKAKVTKNAITMKWTKLSKKNLGGATKYEIWACPNKGFKKADTKVATVSKSKSSGKVKGLKKNTKYYVRIRAIKYVGGVKFAGPWTSNKGIKTKK